MTTETATVSTVEVVASTRHREGLFPVVREALAGTRHDFTKLPVRRAILLLAIPMVAEMLMESLFSLADIFWVSKLGAAATATVVLTESMLIIVYSFAMGLSMGAAAIVARRIGEKDPSGAARASVQAIALGLALAVVVGLVGAFAGHRLLRALGASPDVVAIATMAILSSVLFAAAPGSAPPCRPQRPGESPSVVLDRGAGPNHKLFLATLPVVDLDEASTQIFGEAKAMLARQGRRLADADLLIGAIAAARQATVVTGNRRHYQRIPGITVENWIRD